MDCNNQIVQKRFFSEKTDPKQSKIFIRTNSLPVESAQNHQLRVGSRKRTRVMKALKSWTQCLVHYQLLENICIITKIKAIKVKKKKIKKSLFYWNETFWLLTWLVFEDVGASIGIIKFSYVLIHLRMPVFNMLCDHACN